jgi:dethiobiotin synthetase
VATGFDPLQPELGDSGALLTALGRRPDTAGVEEITPWRFAAALSPDMAAEREQRSITFSSVVDFCAERPNVDVTLIEGIGGIMVPLTSADTVLDWIEALNVPVLLIVGSYLGTLSHTLTAVGMLRARGQQLAGVIVNESAEQPVSLAETADTIARFVEPTPVAVLPRLRSCDEAPDLLPLIAPYL